MSKLVDYFFQSWPIKYHTITGNQIYGPNTWLLKDDSYRIFSPQGPQGEIELTYYDEEGLNNAFAADVSRFCTAAFESMEDISSNETNFYSQGWILIRAYYASFFAAHAIIRLLGEACTNLDSSHVTHLAKIASWSNSQVCPTRGLYHIKIDKASKTLTLLPLSASPGGSHEHAWKILKSSLSDLRHQWLTNTIVGPVPDIQTASLKISDLIETISHSGCSGGNWLSLIRNKINYSHEFGVWFPHHRHKFTRDGILECASTAWRREADQISITRNKNRDLMVFLEAASLLVAICRESVIIIKARYSGKRTSFVQYGPARFLEHIL